MCRHPLEIEDQIVAEQLPEDMAVFIARPIALEPGRKNDGERFPVREAGAPKPIAERLLSKHPLKLASEPFGLLAGQRSSWLRNIVTRGTFI